MTATRWGVKLFATGATATALCLSVLAGWQRGGTLPERLVWIAVGTVLVASAHLLPALVRQSRPVVRGVASVLWLACMGSACFGHATFFLNAQRHAGELRVASVSPGSTADKPGRSLTVVMTERASITARLVALASRRCASDCPQIESRRVALTAKRDALEAEADEVRRWQTADDRIESRRDALAADPVTTRLATLLGTSASRVDLLSGLVFAAVLECVACLLWIVSFESRPSICSSPPVAATVAGSQETPTTDRDDLDAISKADAGESSQTELARLINDIASGLVRPTVADIRRHLRCSQARAIALRQQLAARDPPA